MRGFDRAHPAAQLALFLSILTIVMFIQNPVLQVTALVGGALFAAGRMSRGEAGRTAGTYLLMFLLIALSNPLVVRRGETVLLTLGGRPVTLEALLYGASAATALIAAMLWCRCYTETMTDDRSLYLFGRALPQLALTVSMALRFIPLFRRQARKVAEAQRTSGTQPAGGPVARIRATGRIFFALVGWALEQAMDTAASMRARGYGLKGRTRFALFRFSAADGMLMAVCAALTGTVLAGAAGGGLEPAYYPRLGTLPASPAAMAAYLAYGCLVLLPFLLEMKEELVWRCCVSRV